MDTKIQKLYKFLKENRQYNKQVQEGFIKSCIAIKDLSPEQKVLNLLYGVVNTQSQPKIDKIGPFFKKMYQKDSDLTSYKGFIKTLKKEPKSSDSLFELMKSQNGWGAKTSALFVKYIYLIHTDDSLRDFKIWDDFSLNEYELKLPVDAVITHIFKNNLLNQGCRLDFDGINEFIGKYYSKNNDFIIWDELWFWGFITQKIENNKRVSNEFNENKFWCLQYLEKDIVKIKPLAEKFLQILKNLNIELIDRLL
ncbi:hypothetical protein [Flavobacterium aciduliphilum]|uniref:Uncharacterized protein n=1 Tax=Flavobacterium aciduliphilum TaxID=1101402 RepID=A0A328YTG0_9FLAO|nr:hypothetical protein [Flavobacterium aciduliphilum]RAR73837.1 hypothetical protein CLV55_103156 [Flavobacterium aciduliphilum]